MTDPVNAPAKTSAKTNQKLTLPEIKSDEPLKMYDSELTYPIGLAPSSKDTSDSRAPKQSLMRSAAVSPDLVAYGLPGYFTDPVANGNQLISGSCAKYVGIEPNNYEVTCTTAQLVKMRIPEAGSSAPIPVEKFRMSAPPEAGEDRAQLDPGGMTVGPEGDVRGVLRTSREVSGPQGKLTSVFQSGVVRWPSAVSGTEISSPELSNEPLSSSFADIVKADKDGTLVNVQVDYNATDRDSSHFPSVIRLDKTAQIIQDQPLDTSTGKITDFNAWGATAGFKNVLGSGYSSANFNDRPIIWNRAEDQSYTAETPASQQNLDEFTKFLSLAKKPDSPFKPDTRITVAAEPNPETGKVSVAGGSFTFSAYPPKGGFLQEINQGLIFTRNEANELQSKYIPTWTTSALNPKSVMLSGVPVAIVEGNVAIGNAKEISKDTGLPVERNIEGSIFTKQDAYIFQVGSTEPKRLLDVIKKVDPNVFGDPSGPVKPKPELERFIVDKVLDLGDRWGIVGTYSPDETRYNNEYLVALVSKEKLASNAGIEVTPGSTPTATSDMMSRRGRRR